jgi:cytochrome c oxidase cbb3-type subunit 3
VRIALAIGLVALLASGCEREHRRFRETPPTAVALTGVTMSQLQPGPKTPLVDETTPYEENAYATSEGKRLFSWYNCVGCHSNGGGGMGPPLMDDVWIYGSDPENIYSTIVEGRPNGMPSFRGRIPAQQVWELVAYVRSMSGLQRKGIRPGRNDQMEVRDAENQTTTQKPKMTAVP